MTILTKEECLEALDILKEEQKYLSTNFNYNYPYSISMIKEVQSCFEQLINKHFDNPPLKFDELEEGGMWVWDTKWKEYRQIRHFVVDKEWISFGIYPVGWVAFEENRFYRYQVKENEE